MRDNTHIYQLDGSALDTLMPMGLLILSTGHIGRVGATLAKICPSQDLVGKRFLEVFLITRPRKMVSDFAGLKEIAGSKFRVPIRQGSGITMKGVLVAETGSGGLLVNLSFGFNLVDAVGEYDLTNGDFSQTDLAVEMLYLIEAKSAVMEESRRLNQRLLTARQAAETQALTDALTGLDNRRSMDQVLTRLAASGVQFGLMHVDLDYFKAVNDNLGHAAGDHVLQTAANILVKETCERDTVARVGGDEFVVIFEGLVDKRRLFVIGDRIVKCLENPVEFDGKTCRISGSIGFTTSDFYDIPDLDQMLSDADVALYASKNKGRARTTMVTEKLLADAALTLRNQIDIGAPVSARLSAP
jgi:diguanylate cyclase (GGDEF)-like protein